MAEETRLSDGALMAQRDAPVGGQAVLEGVMMRGVSTWAVAVRKPLPEEIAGGELDPEKGAHGEIAKPGRVPLADRRLIVDVEGCPPLARQRGQVHPADRQVPRRVNARRDRPQHGCPDPFWWGMLPPGCLDSHGTGHRGLKSPARKLKLDVRGAGFKPASTRKGWLAGVLCPPSLDVLAHPACGPCGVAHHLPMGDGAGAVYTFITAS